jgi:hypothetical protein
MMHMMTHFDKQWTGDFMTSKITPCTAKCNGVSPHGCATLEHALTPQASIKQYFNNVGWCAAARDMQEE